MTVQRLLTNTLINDINYLKVIVKLVYLESIDLITEYIKANIYLMSHSFHLQNKTKQSFQSQPQSKSPFNHLFMLEKIFIKRKVYCTTQQTMQEHTKKHTQKKKNHVTIKQKQTKQKKQTKNQNKKQ